MSAESPPLKLVSSAVQFDTSRYLVARFEGVHPLFPNANRVFIAMIESAVVSEHDNMVISLGMHPLCSVATSTYASIRSVTDGPW